MDSMHLKINIPDRVAVNETGITSIVAEAPGGFFGILPHRLDCVAVLVPGILYVRRDGQDEYYVAIDEGVLVKTGLDVVVSVHNAIAGHDLHKMKELVEQEFLQRSEQEQNVRIVLAKIEDDFTRLYREVSE
jgi:F-type H+-transporting ATPase subunit epsilon